MSERDTLTIRVQNMPEDYAQLCQNLRRAGICRTCLLILLVPSASAFAAFVIVLPEWLSYRFGVAEDWATIIGILLLFATGGLPLLFFAHHQTGNMARMFDPSGAFLRPYELTLSPDGITMASAGERLEFHWSAFLKAQETSTHFFLYVDRAIAYIIPKRVFASATEERQFAEFVRTQLDLEPPFMN